MAGGRPVPWGLKGVAGKKKWAPGDSNPEPAD